MNRALLVFALLVANRAPAVAGPWCGKTLGIAPAHTTVLPPSPTVTVTIEDEYYGGKRKGKARGAKVKATLDGKPVTVKTRDVVTRDSVIRFVTVASKKTGRLELWAYNRYTQGDELVAAYTIGEAGDPPTEITGTVAPAEDRRLGPYGAAGKQMAIRVDAPAIAFDLRWRAKKGPWQRLTVPAIITDGQSEARLGQTMCGFSRNVPPGVLENGVELEATAILPDGRKLPVSGIPNPFVMTN